METAAPAKATATMETTAAAEASASVATPASSTAAARIGNIKRHGYRNNQRQSDQPTFHDQLSVPRLTRVICRISIWISG